MVLSASAMAMIAASACGEDETHIEFIGVTDATPPRLGPKADAGSDSP